MKIILKAKFFCFFFVRGIRLATGVSSFCVNSLMQTAAVMPSALVVIVDSLDKLLALCKHSLFIVTQTLVTVLLVLIVLYTFTYCMVDNVRG